jgi:fatty acid/phospholipid biosynthesis enzyme
MKQAHQLTGKVVVDAMGSDHAPHAEIDGALSAARDLGIGVILVGQVEKVEPELRRCGWRGDGDRGIEFVEAEEVIGMDEAVATSVRRKKKSSLRIGSKLVTEGRARRRSSCAGGDDPDTFGQADAALGCRRQCRVQGASPGAVRRHGRRLFARSARR